jgi:hypothetical protein
MDSRLPYRIEVQARREDPILDIYAQAPSTAESLRLANAAVSGMGDYLRDLARAQGFRQEQPVVLRQLGAARGGVVNGSASMSIAFVTFLTVFALSCGALFGLARLRRRRPEGDPRKAPSLRSRVEGLRGDPDLGDDWPHTGRMLPWLLAVFIAVLWLVPFNEIELTISLPIDLNFDRLVLPFVAGAWVLALLAGGRGRPRLQLTWVHWAVGAFVLCAFVGVVLDARHLNQTLEFDSAVKRLPLLLSYLSIFVIAASAVRPTEVRAFLTYTLALALICAVGIIWEYRFKYNVFYEWSDKLLPGIFRVGEAESAGIDAIGRRLVRGPGGVGLEAVAMLTMALPIPLVRAMLTKQWRERIVYGLVTCVLLAATIATYRKSALLAPASVVLTLAWFRRRELLKLAPLALVLLVVVHILSPGAIGSTTSQLDTSRLGVATVSDRAVDYDGVRPDIWSHLAFGRGWGTYDHTSYRILDSEILQRVIETGVIGLIAFLLMGISVVAVARRTIASRHPTWAPPALIGAAVAVSFLVDATLFDVMSFPHAPYIFLYVSGLLAVAVRAFEERPEPEERRVAHLPARTHGPARRSSAARRPAPDRRVASAD